jgi:hypothetical protein
MNKEIEKKILDFKNEMIQLDVPIIIMTTHGVYPHMTVKDQIYCLEVYKTFLILDNKMDTKKP